MRKQKAPVNHWRPQSCPKPRGLGGRVRREHPTQLESRSIPLAFSETLTSCNLITVSNIPTNSAYEVEPKHPFVWQMPLCRRAAPDNASLQRSAVRDRGLSEREASGGSWDLHWGASMN